jgi:hypothetical protein
MSSRSVLFAFFTAAALGSSCLAGVAGPVTSAAAAVPAVSAAGKTSPQTAMELPAPVAQTPVAYTPNVFAGGNCSTYCNPSTVESIAVVNGEAIVGGAFGQVCTPATGATYAACPTNVNADFIFAFDLSTGMIDPNFRPVFDKGPVDSVVAGPNNTVYVGGAFTTVNGSSAPGVTQLHVDPGGLDDGQLVAGFSASTDGEVTSLAYDGSNALYVAGHFGRVDGHAANVARVNATTGAFDSSFQFTISSPPSGRSPKVKVLALSPDGSTLAIAGTFNKVDGQSISRLALISTGGGLGAAATLNNWAAPILATTCLKQTSFINGIDFSPDSSYFVEVNTGYKTSGGPAVCDSAVRFQTGATGSNVQPTWQNYTGGDSLDSAAIVGSVVYIGGHQRWSNNECGNNRVCEPNAVLQNGLTALDANTGLSLPWWHPQTSRGIGIPALTAFPAGAFPGSDGGLLLGTNTNNVGGVTHYELAMFPETTLTAPTPGGPVMSGIWSQGRPGVDEESGPGTGVAAECVDDAGNSSTPGSPVQLVTCTNDNEQNWTVNPGGTITVNGLCLDTQNGAISSGTPAVVNTCTGAATQVWQQGTGNTLVNQAAALCLTDPGSSTTSGTQLQIASCTGGSSQTWPLPVAQAPPPPPPVGSIYSQLVSHDDVPCVKPSGTNIVLDKCIGTPNQAWTAEPDGTFRITGKCLDTAGEGTSSGTLTALATCNGSATQIWTPQPDYTLRQAASGLCLDVPGANAANGTQLNITTCSGATYQMWRVPTY